MSWVTSKMEGKMDTSLLRRMYFVSSPRYVAIKVEKNLLFTLWKKENEPTKEELKQIQTEKELLFCEREKWIGWTRNELEIAETETEIFLQWGWDILLQINFGVKISEITEQHTID